jgi:hypothetical protein
MTPVRRCVVVLLSRAPLAHRRLIASLRATGAVVRIARAGDRLQELLACAPSFVLVDLIHGARLTPGLVAQMNRTRTNTVVLALHDGNLGPFHTEMSDLSVEGFCHAEDPRSLVTAIADHHPMSSLVLH